MSGGFIRGFEQLYSVPEARQAQGMGKAGGRTVRELTLLDVAKLHGSIVELPCRHLLLQALEIVRDTLCSQQLCHAMACAGEQLAGGTFMAEFGDGADEGGSGQEARPDFAVGDAVLAQYSNGEHYGATVREVQGELAAGTRVYTIDWDDGDAEERRQPAESVFRPPAAATVEISREAFLSKAEPDAMLFGMEGEQLSDILGMAQMQFSGGGGGGGERSARCRGGRGGCARQEGVSSRAGAVGVAHSGKHERGLQQQPWVLDAQRPWATAVGTQCMLPEGGAGHGAGPLYMCT